MIKKLVILGIDHGHYKKIIDAAKQRDDVELVAIAHETDSSVDSVAGEYGVKPYNSYMKCLDEEKPDIVGIAMFNGARGEWVLECLNRNIPIIADKPICTTAEELTAIEKALASNPSPLSMMLTCRCDSRFVAIKECVERGEIGEVLSVDAVRYYALNRPGRPDWMFSTQSYGGPTLDILIHDYDLARWITGIEWNELAVREIRTGRYDDNDFNDMAFLNSVDNNRVLNLKMLWHSPQMHWDRFSIYGTKGCIELPLTEKPPRLINEKGEVSTIELSEVKPFAEQFFDALLDNKDEPISSDEIIALSRNILTTEKE